MNRVHPVKLTFAEHAVHLWYVVPEWADDDPLLASYHALMSAAEQAQQQRFVFARDRHRYLVTRALVRTVLSRYAEVEPQSWQFQANKYGRPEISAPSVSVPLRFNVSHADGLIACAVTIGRDIGVDVEAVDRPGQTVEIAERFFSPAEVAALRALPTEAQRDRFFDFWTLKESYIKARGMGLSIPLDQFSFHLDPSTIRITFDPRLQDASERWQFMRFRWGTRHAVALAVGRATGEPDVCLQVRRTLPLRSDSPEQW